MAAGIRGFRQTRGGAERGIFCGMGVCQDCLVQVDGQANQRACMTKLDRSMAVHRESVGRELSSPATVAPPRTIEKMPEEKPEVLVVGAGPGGLSAAIAAQRAGARVVVVDERALPGGQYFKQIANELGTPKVVICPYDKKRKVANDFIDFGNSNISYFIGLYANGVINHWNPDATEL